LIELSAYQQGENDVSAEEEMVAHFDQMNKVVSKYLEGSDETKISKELSISRQKVVSFVKEWKQLASSNEVIRARAKEALAAADHHYSKLISQAYEVIDEANTIGNLNAKTTAIKLVMDLESRRIDMLQKAGLLENKELAEELIETERKQDVLVQILKDIAAEYPEIRDDIMRRLAQVSKPGEAVTVVHNV